MSTPQLVLDSTVAKKHDWGFHCVKRNPSQIGAGQEWLEKELGYDTSKEQ